MERHRLAPGGRPSTPTRCSSFTQVVAATFPAPPNGTYMKQGLYRGGNVNGRTDVLWVGPTARGSTFSAVERAAFNTNVGP